MTNAQIKVETLRLYDSLPQEAELRKQRTDVRDRVIELNYTFFGYVASHTYVNNPCISYEDKLQSALLHFCECWWWYKYATKYRTDLSFATFFKPRLSEMIDRELTEVKYSVYRPLKMEVGDQLGKHWSKVRYEDLSDPRVHLSADKMNSLKAIFGSLYFADLGEYEPFLSGDTDTYSEIEKLDDKYNTVEELLVHEMIDRESKLTDSMLLQMSDIYGIRYDILKEKLPAAEQMLYKMCHDAIDINEAL